ncbi:MAG: peptide deformylase [Bacillota bacterium]|nr:peptide deformylase [Bacillota bacterium]
MALRRILKVGEDILRKKSRPVEKIDGRILELIEDLKETLKDAEGVGLAAPQVGILRRVAIVNSDAGLIELINPKILETEGEVESEEGCLSVPDRVGIILRPNKLTICTLDKNGEEQTMECEGLLARVICHEIDHLDGILILDKMIREVKE